MAARKKRVARTELQNTKNQARSSERLIFAEEMLRNALDVMAALDLRPEESQQAYENASKRRRRPGGASKQFLDRVHCLGDLLSHWRNESPFVDSEGNPKVLLVRGRGSTLEALAKRYVPGMRINEVVNLLIRYSDVQRVKRDKVALLGTTFLLVPKTSDYTMATITLGFRRYSRTILHNAKNPPERGHFQRRAAVKLPSDAFALWIRRDTPRLHQFLVDTEKSLSRASKRGKGRDCGIELLGWIDD